MVQGLLLHSGEGQKLNRQREKKRENRDGRMHGFPDGGTYRRYLSGVQRGDPWSLEGKEWLKEWAAEGNIF